MGGTDEPRRRRAVLGCEVLMIALVAGLVSCTGESRVETTSAGTEAEIPDVGLSPLGTPIADGIVVPPGTRLIGPAFPRPVGSGEPLSTVAVLLIDGDPFAAWDDVARQAAKIGAPLPRSGLCSWLDSTPETGRSLPHPVSVKEPRPEAADTLTCGGSARGTAPGGGSVTVIADMWWWPAGAELGLQVEVSPTPGAEVRTFPETDPGPAPGTAAAQLPERNDPVLPDVGEPFGRDNNSLEAGYGRLRVPPGARLVGGGTTPVIEDFAAVLAVADVRPVLERLLEQLDPTGPNTGEGSFTIEKLRLPDGGSVWRLAGGANGGGGACDIWSSPNGRSILVTTHSD